MTKQQVQLNTNAADVSENDLRERYPEALEVLLRDMLGTLKVTQHNPIDTWAHVPLQDFTSASDIDWGVSIPEIDQQLYKKYGLSADEINFIETAIKPME